jgi:hypothetical protein
MTRKLFFALGPLVATAVALAAGLGLAGSAAAGCLSDALGRGTADAGTEVALGETPAALAEGRIVVIDEASGARRSYERPDGLGGVARHIAAAPGSGTAYVADLAGRDVVVAISSGGVAEIPAQGEAAHPAWSSRGDLAWVDGDFAVLRVRSFRDGSVRDIPPPSGSVAVFGPIFTGSTEITAVVQEPQEGSSAEDATVDNLWRLDLARGTWRRLTSFSAGGSLWTAIRTPILEPGGSVAFVRVHGDGKATEGPSFELWRLSGAEASRVRDLGGEMFLAGASDQGLLWNVHDGVEWQVSIDRGRGPEPLGCGAVAVDPRTEPDPDMAPDDEGAEGVSTEPIDETPMDAQLAVLVGDFPTQEAASAVAAELGFEVIDHTAAPGAVAPDAWAAVTRLAPDVDPETALAEFRSGHPEYAERSYIVSLAGGG